MKVRFVLLFAPFVPLVSGCAELRSEFLPATGEPLRVHDVTVNRTGVEQVETGHTENSKGETTSTSYENQTVHWQEREWWALQGGARLDDESAYRITHDEDAVRRYDDYHRGGVRKNVLGWILLPFGIGLAGGGAGAWFYGSSMKDTSGKLTQDGNTWTTAGYVGLGVGAGLAIIAGTLIMLGKKEAAATDVRLIDDPARMKADAARYDRALMSTGTLAPPPWQRLYRR